MVSLRDFAAQLLGIIWRKYITLRLHELYFTNKNFYYLQQPKFNEAKNSAFSCDSFNEPNPNIQSTSVLIDDSLAPKLINPTTNKYDMDAKNQSNLDNPDQRIVQDVNTLCQSLSSILPVLLISPFVMGWYTYQVSLIVLVYSSN